MSGEMMIRPTAKSIGLSGYGGRKKQTLLTAARHNLRDIQSELGANGHIDAGRIGLNEVMAGPDSPAGINELALARMAAIGFKPKRKDYTQAHELLFPLGAKTQLNTRAFFQFCLDFLIGEFGADSVLSATAHYDESAPHLHVLLIPIADGEYVGSALITKSSFAELIDRFTSSAFKAFRVRVAKPMTGPQRARATETVHEALKTMLGPHITDALLEAILSAAKRNPSGFMAALGIVPSELNDGGAAFQRIALSTGKGGKTERAWKPYGFEGGAIDDVPKPYGFESGHEDDRENIETIPCVVSAKESPSLSSPLPAPPPARPVPPLPARPPEPAHADQPQASQTSHQAQTATAPAPSFNESVRVRDSEINAALYDPTTGEFFNQPPLPARHNRTAADSWVSAALASRKTSQPYQRTTP